jgi:hypothetical protein
VLEKQEETQVDGMVGGKERKGEKKTKKERKKK